MPSEPTIDLRDTAAKYRTAAPAMDVRVIELLAVL
jgi:hypothetical protein